MVGAGGQVTIVAGKQTLLSPHYNETCKWLSVPGASRSPHKRLKSPFPEGWRVGKQAGPELSVASLR